MKNEEIIIQYIYILQEREFIKTGEPIYKIGKTRQVSLGRFSQYPNGSVLYFQLIVPDCDKLEKMIIRNFKIKYIQRTDIGREYFQGDVFEMMECIYQEVFAFRRRIESTISSEVSSKQPTKTVEKIESIEPIPELPTITFDFDKFRYKDNG
jgi:hypothetical protein